MAVRLDLGTFRCAAQQRMAGRVRVGVAVTELLR